MTAPARAAAPQPAWKTVPCPKCKSGPGTPCFRPRLGAPAQLLRCSPHAARLRLIAEAWASADVTPAPSAGFDPLVFDMLRAAVNLGRAEQLRTAARLRARMAEVYPTVPSAVVEAALDLWGEYARRTRPHELSGNQADEPEQRQE